LYAHRPLIGSDLDRFGEKTDSDDIRDQFASDKNMLRVTVNRLCREYSSRRYIFRVSPRTFSGLTTGV
jgi:hypothetical protein